MKVEVLNIEEGGFFNDGNMSGNCVKVTLRRGKEIASCDGILIWEDEYAEDCFDEWVECAKAGEEGYTYSV